MDATSSSHDWLARFSVRLIELLPGLDGPMAIRRAVHSFPDWRAVAPERAAETYVARKRTPEKTHALH